MKQWWLVYIAIFTIVLVFSSCARPPLPNLTPAVKAIGTTVTKQDEAKDSDTWASYLQGESIRAIGVGQDCLWLGTDSGLICVCKKGSEISITRYTEADGLLGSDVQAVKVYKGGVWIGTRDGGLSKFDGVKFSSWGKDEGLFNPRVMALDVDENSVWLGLCLGLSRFHKRSQTFHNFELPGGYTPGVGSGSGEGAGFDPRRIYADSILIEGEYIWHASFNVKRSNQDLTHSVEIGCGSLPSSRVTSICREANCVYAATTEGLSRVDLTDMHDVDRGWFDKFRWFTKEDGLSSDGISALLSDGRYLWVGTNKGIDRFDTESLEIGYYEGYPGGLVLSLAADERYIWIGTLNGLLRLNKMAEPK